MVYYLSSVPKIRFFRYRVGFDRLMTFEIKFIDGNCC